MFGFDDLLIPVGMSLIGGLLGSEEKTVGKTEPTSRTTVSNGSSSHGSSTQNKIDPRMEQAIYGAGGIMPNAAAWYAQNQSGLNDKMITGMNNQWNQLGASKQGFDQMQNLGMGLMGGGTAGNPFTGGGGIAAQKLSYNPAQMEMSSNANSPFVMPTPMAAPAMLPSYGGGGSGGGYSEPTPAPAVATPQEPAPEPLFDTEGMIIGYNNRSGYRGDAYSPAPAYQFNNGYTAYGADGSSAANPSGGGGGY